MNQSMLSQIMLARQPIFNNKKEIHGYELLYRGNMDVCDDTMTATVLNHALYKFGIDTVTDGSPFFVNLSKKFLSGEFPNLLPPKQAVLEIMGSAIVDDSLIDSVQQWRDKGFTVALDDFISMESLASQLLPYVDIVKVDILDFEGDLKALVADLRKYPVQLLAEKVETYGQYVFCDELGFNYFQGYFFSKPALIVKHRHLEANKASALKLLSKVMAAEHPHEFESDIAHDLALSYKLLCYINSAAVGLRRKVDSIRHALNLMGLENIRVWLTMLLFASLGDEKPTALMHLAFARGKFLELLALAENEQAQKNEYFILGMFSLLDAILDMDMNTALQPISLPPLVAEGLQDSSSKAAKRLQLLTLIEQAKWLEVSQVLVDLGLAEESIAAIYSDAISWADEQVVFLKNN